MLTYRTNADGSAICAHRDLSVCDECVAADERLIEVEGTYVLVASPTDRRALREALEAIAEGGQDGFDAWCRANGEVITDADGCPL